MGATQAPNFVDPWQCLAACCLAAICLCDLLERRIPNRLCQTVLLCGLCAGLRGGFGGLLNAAGGACFALALGLGPYLRRWLGGGDVKAFTALGSFLGAALVPRAAIFATLLGGLTALAVVSMPYFFPADDLNANRHLSVPYAVAICGGCAWALWIPAPF